MMTMMMMEGGGVEKEEEEKELIFITYWLNVLSHNHWGPTWRSSSLNNWMEVSIFCLGVQVLPITRLYRIYWWRRKVQQRLWGSCIHHLAGHPQVLTVAQRGRWLVPWAASMSSWKGVPGWWPHSCWTQSSLFFWGHFTVNQHLVSCMNRCCIRVTGGAKYISIFHLYALQPIWVVEHFTQ